MKFKDVKAGLNAYMQTVFPMISDDPTVQTYEYYGLEVTEGYTTPCFFTRLTAGESRPSNKNTLYHRLTYGIMYVPPEPDEIDIMDKLDAIRDLFELGCPIEKGDEKRYLDCIGFDWDYGGTERDILEISVDLEYLTDIRKPVTAEIMKDATIIFNGGTDDEWNA